jgi:hypothetical protein
MFSSRESNIDFEKRMDVISYQSTFQDILIIVLIVALMSWYFQVGCGSFISFCGDGSPKASDIPLRNVAVRRPQTSFVPPLARVTFLRPPLSKFGSGEVLTPRNMKPIGGNSASDLLPLNETVQRMTQQIRTCVGTADAIYVDSRLDVCCARRIRGEAETDTGILDKELFVWNVPNHAYPFGRKSDNECPRRTSRKKSKYQNPSRAAATSNALSRPPPSQAYCLRQTIPM